jgi:ferredoxin-NADP reductase
MAQPIRFAAIVERVVRHTPDVASYRLRSVKRLPGFVPGQFVHLTIEPYDPAGFWPESRVFSVANAVSDRQTVDLTISRQGAYTGRILDHLEEGRTVWLKGPYGEFNVGASEGVRRAVLIAGGTGITPFCAFMDAALAKGALPMEEVWLYYGARIPDLLIYRTLAEECVHRFPGFQAHFYAENADGLGAPARHGRLNPGTIVTELADIERTAFYISGPRLMIDYFVESLSQQYGVRRDLLILDSWE